MMSDSVTGRRVAVLGLSAALAAAAFLYRAPAAEACGCFTPPDPSVPIVQAGERIAFAQDDNGNIIAHIQIQYSGPAEEFGWLLPLPSEPGPLKLGVDELFTQLIRTTQPLYRVTREYVGDCPFDPSNQGDGDGDVGVPDPASPSDPGPGGDSPVVREDSVGPFDYAVLRADSKEPMLQWLADNRYFVPAGTDDAVDPYIRPNAFFLALKLRKGKDVGDLQPVVVEYKSDLPMIPLVLTSVAAEPNMGVMVWVLGEHRAIPRNYNHTRINDAAIDWLDAGSNYVQVLSDAVNDAQGGTSFVTEFAGSTNRMEDVLDPPWRFGDVNELKGAGDAVTFLAYLRANDYYAVGAAPLLAILQRELPLPAQLAAEGVTPINYYFNIEYFLQVDRLSRPEAYEDLDLDIDTAATGDEIEARIVVPALEAGELFRANSYMTRVFTTLDPSEMVRDPVFSFNPDLPPQSNEHVGRLIYYCGPWGDYDDPGRTPARLVTEDGWVLSMPDGTDFNPWRDVDMPQSRYTENLREEGDADIVWDRSDEIRAILEGGAPSSSGCSLTGASGGVPALMVLGVAIAAVVRRRRRRC